jgi:single-stranded-DNA-specific exonuclease
MQERGRWGSDRRSWQTPAPSWDLEETPSPHHVRILQQELRLPEVLCALLVVRGLTEPEEAKDFLRPLLTHLHPPRDLPDLSPAVERVLSAVQGGQTILVHGDYDVDGMAGTALLTRWLRRMGARVVPFVPHRVRDGYDLGPRGLEVALAQGCSLMITVDCGIRAHSVVDDAGREGVDVVITDHHAPGTTLPRAVAVLDPARSDSTYPESNLSGTGVVFKLCQALADAAGIPPQELWPFLDLVGLATIADLVPLGGENRVLARFGLKALAHTSNPGLRALMREAGMERGETMTPGSVGFGLAPRLNALGRLGEATDGLALLLTDDPMEAGRLARKAEGINRERQEADGTILAEVMERLESGFDPEKDFGLVLESETWHPGIIGIVASRVVERTHRPVVLLAMDGDRGRGSARSIPEFALLDGIESCAHYLERFGGHRLAAGMEILREQVDAFRDAFNAEARRSLSGLDLRPRLPVDLEVVLSDMTADLYRYSTYLGPHGIGNPGPNFLARRVTLAHPPRVVGSDHLKLRLLQGSAQLDAIGFGLAGRIPPASFEGGPLDVVFQLRENEFRGVRRLQARIKDLRPARTEPGKSGGRR